MGSIQLTLSGYSAQIKAFEEMKDFQLTQNRKILFLLKTNQYVPIKAIKDISSQYNRSISDLRKQGHVIQSVKVEINGKNIWVKKLIGFDLHRRLKNEYP